MDVGTLDAQEILNDAINQDASDIFIVAGSPIAFKIKGKIIKQETEKLKPSDTTMFIKQLYEFAPYKEYEYFDREGDDDFSFSLSKNAGHRVNGRFRVNVYRQRNSNAAVLRVVKFDLPNYKELHIPQNIIDLYKEKKGMILVCGPAGSGKSTTLACIIDQINSSREAHVITIEDPIEFLHTHKKGIVSQREVFHDTKGYLTALRAALRETPEVILLGEMRDPETIQTALTAAETGHLLLSTLHTTGAVNAINRILDSFTTNREQIRAQLAMVLHAIVSVQLVQTIDNGVIPVFEVMKVNNAIRSHIREENKLHMIENTMTSCKQEGMITMDESLLNLVKEKRITKQTAIQYSVHPEIMLKKLAYI